MKVLLDENLPRALKFELAPHQVSTVQELGWAGIANGTLLTQAQQSKFEVFITADRNMQYQNVIARFALGLIVLKVKSTRLPDIIPLVPAIAAAIPLARAGAVTEIG